MSHNLAEKLRVGTQKSHTAAENVGFMKCFLQGAVNRDCFAKFLSNLYYVYSELEAALLTYQEHPVLCHLNFPELYRQAYLAQDLNFYYGKNWQSQIIPTKATLTYTARIREVCGIEPELLVAHAYTRYMGDLSGGQMLCKIVQSVLKLSDYEGTSFYNFEQIPDKKAFKQKYRQALDILPISNVTADRIVVEANHAFRLNMQMVQDLEAILIKIIGQDRYNNLIRSHNPGSTEMIHKA